MTTRAHTARPSAQYIAPGHTRQLPLQCLEAKAHSNKQAHNLSLPAMYLPSLSSSNPSLRAQGSTAIPPGSKGCLLFSFSPGLELKIPAQGAALPSPSCLSKSPRALSAKEQDSAAAIGLTCLALLSFWSHEHRDIKQFS